MLPVGPGLLPQSVALLRATALPWQSSARLISRAGPWRCAWRREARDAKRRSVRWVASMSPGLVVVLLITILYGPIAAWLVLSALRGPRVRFHQPSTAVSESIGSSHLAPGELVTPVASDGFWVCGTCSSLNRREANRCYSCRTVMGLAGEQSPGGRP